MVVEAIVGELLLRTRHQVFDKQIVVAHKGHFGCIRRERGETLFAILRKRLQGLGLEVIYIIGGVVRVTIDALHIGDTQHLVLIGTQLVVLQTDGHVLAFQNEVADAEQGIHEFSCLVVVDVELAFLEGGV